MSEQSQEMAPSATKPIKEHEWLQKLVGNWRFESVMSMGPGQPEQRSQGTETVQSLGGLWAHVHGKAQLPDGVAMEYYSGLGYDVSFKEYRGFWMASVSSHLWKYTGVLSPDGKTMTLSCVGLSMVKDGETANYRDVIELIDENHRTLTSYGEDDSVNWQQFYQNRYTRA